MQAVAESWNTEDPLPETHLQPLAGSGNEPVAGALIAGRYRLSDIIGRGGMATVWRGHDLRLERDVAIKICPPTAADFAPAFREERIASALLHPNIVSIFDAGDLADDEPGAGGSFIVMEHVDGTTAHAIAPVGWQTAAGFVRQAAEGIAAAHDQGIVHCDVKPGNLLIDRTGRVRVADFGIAMTTTSESGQYVHGSPAYIAPERMTGARPEPSVDIYGLGGVLLFLITGQRPSDGPVILPPECPAKLGKVIDRARASDPRDRYATARAFLSALDAAIATDRQPATDGAASAASDATVQLSHLQQPQATPEPSRRVISHPMRVRPSQAQPRPPTRQAAGPVSSPNRLSRPATGSAGHEPVIQPAPRSRLLTLIAAGSVGLLVLFLSVSLLNRLISTETVAPGPSSASAAIEMPDVVGQSFAAAIERLSDNGLTVERVEVIYGPGPLNQVVAQTPSPGEAIDSGDSVTLIVPTTQ